MFARVESHRLYNDCGNMREIVNNIYNLNHFQDIQLNGRRMVYRGQMTCAPACVSLAFFVDPSNGDVLYVNEYGNQIEEIGENEYWADLRPVND